MKPPSILCLVPIVGLFYHARVCARRHEGVSYVDGEEVRLARVPRRPTQIRLARRCHHPAPKLP